MTGQPNAAQRDAWNGESGLRWVESADRRDQVLAPIVQVLLDSAAIGRSDSVLDVGCGCGATTIAAARYTGSTGTVTGVDLSRPMLNVARRRVEQAGLESVALRESDAQTADLSCRFDVAISRFGTMFFDNPPAAFANLSRHLRRGGRLCMATWQPLAANEWLVVPGSALLEYGEWPAVAEVDGPGMFAQSDPARIAEVLRGSGFHDVRTTPHTLALAFGESVDEAVEYLADSGPGRAILETIAADHHDAALDAVHQVLRPHLRNGAVTLGAAIYITTAVSNAGR